MSQIKNKICSSESYKQDHMTYSMQEGKNEAFVEKKNTEGSHAIPSASCMQMYM